MEGNRIRPTQSNIFDWFTVKKSSFAREGQLGLFAARNFKSRAIITANVGNMVGPQWDPTRKVTLKKVSVDVKNRKRFSFGTHCLNSPYWGISVEERNIYDTDFFSGRKHDAVFEGLEVQACKGKEILLDYAKCSPSTIRILR